MEVIREADAVVTVAATAVVEVATKVAEHGVPDPDHKVS